MVRENCHFANTLACEYIDQNLDLKTQGTQNMIDWLDKEVQKQDQKVKDSERVVLKLDASDAGGRLFKRDFKA